jgi:hypothetical protein
MNNSKLLLQSWQNAYLDNNGSSNPPMNYASWKQYRTFDVSNPKMTSHTVDPNGTLSLFSGARTTSISNTTQFTLSLSPLPGGIYRFTWTGAGANPAFRIDRGINLSTQTVALVLNSNQTLTVTANSSSFSAIVAGDTVFIPGTTTGDSASPFSPLNVGYWQVLAADPTGAILQLGRSAATYFSGKTENVVVASGIQFQAYSAAGVQVGDKVDITAGFTSPVIGTYTVSSVNSKWFEVISTLPLPVNVSATPTVAGINFYSSAKRYLRIEGDQTFIAQVNGDTSNFNRIIPWSAGSESGVGEFISTNSIWSLVIVNQSSVALNINVLTVE